MSEAPRRQDQVGLSFVPKDLATPPSTDDKKEPKRVADKSMPQEYIDRRMAARGCTASSDGRLADREAIFSTQSASPAQ